MTVAVGSTREGIHFVIRPPIIRTARIMAAPDNNAARMWDAVSGKSIAEPMKHENRLRSALFIPMVSEWE